MARGLPRMQGGRGDNLGAQVGCGIYQDLVLAVPRNTGAGLRTRSDPAVALPGTAVDRAEIIPLRKPAAGGGAQHDGHQPPHVMARPERAGSEFGGQIAVDFQSDANFNEGRGSPGHNGPHKVNWRLTLARWSPGTSHKTGKLFSRKPVRNGSTERTDPSRLSCATTMSAPIFTERFGRMLTLPAPLLQPVHSIDRQSRSRRLFRPAQPTARNESRMRRRK